MMNPDSFFVKLNQDEKEEAQFQKDLDHFYKEVRRDADSTLFENRYRSKCN